MSRSADRDLDWIAALAYLVGAVVTVASLAALGATVVGIIAALA